MKAHIQQLTEEKYCMYARPDKKPEAQLQGGAAHDVIVVITWDMSREAF